MMLLPKTVGPFTLLKKLGTGVIAESYQGTLNTQNGRPVMIRRVLPFVQRDPARLASIEARIRDLIGVRHPFLVQVLDWVVDGDERFIVEEWVDGIDLSLAFSWYRQHKKAIPHNVFLNIATQICNGLEALHGRPGKGTGSDHVLHLRLKPSSVIINNSGKVVLGGFGLARTPLLQPLGGLAAPMGAYIEYLSPEQTHTDQSLSPASDIFSLGTLLYELLTLQPLFRGATNDKTIEQVQRAEVTTQLLHVKEIMPGMDKLLYRALSLNPRHRYQRAFVFREDLRGLMAGYSFKTIVEDTLAFVGELAGQESGSSDRPGLDGAPDSPPDVDAFDDQLPTRVDPDPTSTAAHAAQALAERAIREQHEKDQVPLEEQLSPPLPYATPVELGETADHTLETDEQPIEAPLPQEPNTTREYLAAQEGEEISPVPPPVLPPASTFAPPVQPISIPSAPPISTPPAAKDSVDIPPPVIPAMVEEDAFAAQGMHEPAPRAALSISEEEPQITQAIPVEEPQVTQSIPVEEEEADDEAIPALAVEDTPFVSGEDTNIAMEPAAEEQLPWSPPPDLPPQPQPPLPQDDRGNAFSQANSSADAPEDDDLDWKPKRSKLPLMFGTAAIALGVIGGLGGAMMFLGSSEEPTPEEAATAPVDEEQAAEEPATPAVDGDDEDATADVEEGEASTNDDALSQLETPSQDAPKTTQRSEDTDNNDWEEPEEEPEEVATVSSSRSEPPSERSSAREVPSASTSDWDDFAPDPVIDEPEETDSTLRTMDTDPVEEFEVADAMLGDEDSIGDVAIESHELDRYSTTAKGGNLTSSDIMYLEMVEIDDPAYTRARTLLLMDAQRKGDSVSTKQYLDEIMTLTENQYNPIYLTDLAHYYTNKGRYQRAIDSATLAERYWARLPSSLVFSKKAEMYEIQAASYQGLFYRSEDNIALLDEAVRHWEKYRRHVQTKSRKDMVGRADTELAKLEDIRRRLD